MENFEQRWQDVETLLQDRFDKTPDMEGILFLIGINELGGWPKKKFTKEQKQDLMHIAVCTLLSRRGYFQFAGRDDDGWPHYNPVKEVETTNMQEQEQLLKECAIEYFEQ